PRHHRRSGPELPRPRCAAADTLLGSHDQRGTRLPSRCTLDGARPRHRGAAHLYRHQSFRRFPAGRLRSPSTASVNRPMANSLLTVSNLSVEYPPRHGWLRAVNDVSLELAPGMALGVVGESGSGKSTLGQ